MQGCKIGVSLVIKEEEPGGPCGQGQVSEGESPRRDSPS